MDLIPPLPISSSNNPSSSSSHYIPNVVSSSVTSEGVLQLPSSSTESPSIVQSSIENKNNPSVNSSSTTKVVVVVPSTSTSTSSSSPSSNNSSSSSLALCRDFVRNVCYRGSSCKYSHSSASTNLSDHLQNDVLFCHDFQNNDLHCPRAHCRFIHATKQEEEIFKASGYLAPLAKEEAIRKGMAPDLPALYGQKPFCKDYLKNSCTRSSCKFRHITPMQYDYEISQCFEETEEQMMNQSSAPKASRPSITTPSSSLSTMNNNSIILNTSPTNSIGHKRRNNCFYSGGTNSKYPRGATSQHQQQNEMLKRVNLQLKQQVEDLKKRVSDLSTTNEFLLDQNAQLRLARNSSQGDPVSSGPNAGAPQPPLAPPVLPIASINCIEGCTSGSPVAIGVPPNRRGPPPVPVSLVAAAAPSSIVNPAISQQPRIDPSVTSINLRPTMSLAPNSALVQETRFLSYPITSILPPMQ